MSLPPLRLAIIGYGNIGRIHEEAALAVDSVELVALVDPRFASGLRLASPCASFVDHHSMLAATEIDIACVAAPARHHRAIVEDLAEADIPVLCEKPLADSSRDAQAMVDACAAAGVLLAYGASYRFLPAVRAAHALVRSGAIGTVRLMRESVIGGAGRPHDLGELHYPRGQPGGGPLGLFDHGIHLADMFRWFTDSEMRRGTGRGNRSGGELMPEYLSVEMECGAIGQLCYDDGTYAVASHAPSLVSAGSGWNLEGPFDARDEVTDPGHIDIHGSDGSLRVFHYANALFLNDREGSREVPCPGRPPAQHFATQLEEFAQAVRSGLPFEATGEDGVAALRIIEAAYADQQPALEPAA